MKTTKIEDLAFSLSAELRAEAANCAMDGDIYGVHYLVSQSFTVERLARNIKQRFDR